MPLTRHVMHKAVQPLTIHFRTFFKTTIPVSDRHRPFSIYCFKAFPPIFTSLPAFPNRISRFIA